MAEETQAGRSHQQSTNGLLPEGVEDPAEVPRPLHRRIRVAVFYHERGSVSLTPCVCVCGFTGDVCVTVCLFLLCVDDSKRDQVCGAGGVRPEPRPSARVPAAARGDHDGSGSGS